MRRPTRLTLTAARLSEQVFDLVLHRFHGARIHVDEPSLLRPVVLDEKEGRGARLRADHDELRLVGRELHLDDAL